MGGGFDWKDVHYCTITTNRAAEPPMSGSKNRGKWIETGYRIFAESGPAGIRVNEMAKQVGVSRTSFYHHFGSTEQFIEVLLEHHEARLTGYLVELRNCRDYEPDFIELIIAHREAYLFHRRLLMNRSVPSYADCAARIDEATIPRTFELWSTKHGLGHLGNEAMGLFSNLAESWWTRIGPDSFEYDTLKRLDEEITADLRRVLQSLDDRAPSGGRTTLRLVSGVSRQGPRHSGLRTTE